MTTLHMLTLRTTAAVGRLAALQKRAEKAVTTTPIVRAALRELADTVEELRVANEQLQQHSVECNELKSRVQDEASRMREFADALPVACIWTTADAVIVDANPAAADLLNVSAPHLVGRPLMLFTVERQRFQESLASLNDGLTTVVEVPAVLRPRERRPRSVRLVGRRLNHDNRRCWFILEVPDPPFSASA